MINYISVILQVAQGCQHSSRRIIDFIYAHRLPEALRRQATRIILDIDKRLV